MEKADGKKRQLVGIFDHSAEKRILAEVSESEWSFVNSSWLLQIERDSDKRRCIVDLRGDPSVSSLHTFFYFILFHHFIQLKMNF